MTQQTPQTPSSISYYEILSITPSNLDTSPDPSHSLKRAYHRALLLHHPDKKSKPSTTSSPPANSTLTIDQISTAFAVLSSPSRRADYDKALALSRQDGLATAGAGNGQFQTGIHDIDLDDLEFDEDKEQWYRSCRCGNPRGYAFGEADLEEASDYGEVMVGCLDCSLWLRVHFAVVEDEEEEEGNGDGDEDGDDGKRGKS